MPHLTLTIDTADLNASEAIALLVELRTARDNAEGITIRTAGAAFTVDVTDVRPTPEDGHEDGTLGAFLHDRKIPGVPCGCVTKEA